KRYPWRRVSVLEEVCAHRVLGKRTAGSLFPYTTLFRSVVAALGLAEVYSSLLASRATALWAIMGAFVWRWAGFNTVIYLAGLVEDRKSTRLNSSHVAISYAVFCLKKNKRTRGAPHLGDR